MILCEPLLEEVVDLLCHLSARCHGAPPDLAALALSRLNPNDAANSSPPHVMWHVEDKHHLALENNLSPKAEPLTEPNEVSLGQDDENSSSGGSLSGDKDNFIGNGEKVRTGGKRARLGGGNKANSSNGKKARSSGGKKARPSGGKRATSGCTVKIEPETLTGICDPSEDASMRFANIKVKMLNVAI